MSLSKLPVDLVNILSGLVDGVALINLIRCGNRLLNHTLYNSKTSLCFEVNHYGFLNVPRVLASLATQFPSAKTLIFIDIGTKGCPIQFDISSLPVDIALLESTRLAISTFSYLGNGAFVIMLNKCLEMVESKLDDIFPCVVNWTAGKFTKQIPSEYLHNYYYSLNPNYSFAVKSVIPSASRIVRASSITSDFYLDSTRQPLEELDLTVTTIRSSLLSSTASFQSLTKISVCYVGALNARDLPRGLTLFTAHANPFDFSGNVRRRSPFILSDPPAGLKILQLSSYNRLIFPKDEFAPLRCLKRLSVSRVSDLSHRLSASTLPVGLTFLYIGELSTSDDGMDQDLPTAKIVPLDQHLFCNVQTDAWATAWPHKLAIAKQDVLEEADEMKVLIDRLGYFTHLESCLYTLQCILRDVHSDDTSPFMVQLKQRIGLPDETLTNSLKDGSFRVNGISLQEKSLKLLYDALQESVTNSSCKVIPTISALSISTLSETEEEHRQKTFVVENIYRLCPNISTWSYTNYRDGLPIFESVRELAIDQYPTKPFMMVSTSSIGGRMKRITSSDSLESLSIRAAWNDAGLFEWNNAKNSSQRCRFINSQVPRFLFELPLRLTTLDIQFARDEAKILASCMPKWLASLPRTLYYVHLRCCTAELPTEYVPSRKDASFLPPNLRIINLAAFIATHNNIGLFCRDVSSIPSLHRLMMEISTLRDAPSTMHVSTSLATGFGRSKYTTIHCHSFAKTFVNQVDCQQLVNHSQLYKRRNQQMLALLGLVFGVVALPIVGYFYL